MSFSATATQHKIQRDSKDKNEKREIPKDAAELPVPPLIRLIRQSLLDSSAEMTAEDVN